jgi:hypothetical protein
MILHCFSLKSIEDLSLKSMEDLLVYFDQLLFEQLQINLGILCLSSNDTFIEKHFVGRTFRRQNMSSTEYVVDRTFRRQNMSSTEYVVDRTLR